MPRCLIRELDWPAGMLRSRVYSDALKPRFKGMCLTHTYESTHDNEFHNGEVRDIAKNGIEGSQLADLIQGSDLIWKKGPK